jgi:SAM-dependent methyltransferase
MSTASAPAAKAHYRRALELLRARHAPQALGATVEAVNADPSAVEPAQLLAKLLQQFTLDASPPVAAALAASLAHDDVHHQPLIRSAINCLLADPALMHDDALPSPLLLGVLRRGICHDIAFERQMIALRRRVLSLVDDPPPWWRDLATALALQAAHNEYAWPVSDEEQASIAALQSAQGGSEALARAMYEAPSPALREIFAATQPDDDERARRAAIPSLRPSADDASRRVAGQYEENPYPRWLSFDPPEPGERLAALRRHLPAGARDIAGPIDVLIAGCGTGRQALAAAIGYGPDARLLALDLSAASLAYAARMAARYAVTNISFLQADLRDVARLGKDFDVIEAVGVLHHIADPRAAWRALAGQLKPGGMMKIGLYSQRARRAIVAAREEIAQLGLADDLAGIRALRRRVLDAPEAPRDWRHLLPRFTDFFTASGCRDLVFHRLEHRFTPADLAAALRDIGLEFRGFELPARVLARFATRHPAPRAARDLGLWEQFEVENPDIFAGMFRFWCAKPSA